MSDWRGSTEKEVPHSAAFLHAGLRQVAGPQWLLLKINSGWRGEDSSPLSICIFASVVPPFFSPLFLPLQGNSYTQTFELSVLFFNSSLAQDYLAETGRLKDWWHGNGIGPQNSVWSKHPLSIRGVTHIMYVHRQQKEKSLSKFFKKDFYLSVWMSERGCNTSLMRRLQHSDIEKNMCCDSETWLLYLFNICFMHWLFSCSNHCLLFFVFFSAVSIMRHSASAFGFAVSSAVKTSQKIQRQHEKQYWPCEFLLFNSIVWRHAGCVVFRHRAVAVQQRSRGPLSAPRVHVSTLFTLHASLLVQTRLVWVSVRCRQPQFA